MSGQPHWDPDDQGKKLYIGNLSEKCTSRDLEDHFSKFGEIRSVWVARNPPGFAFVTFEDARDAADCVNDFDGSKFQNKTIRVEVARGPRRGGGPGRGDDRDGPPGRASKPMRDIERAPRTQRRSPSYRNERRSPSYSPMPARRSRKRDDSPSRGRRRGDGSRSVSRSREHNHRKSPEDDKRRTRRSHSSDRGRGRRSREDGRR
eukprot:TRINITY_DN156941_c0_g1_i1.p1 TRINITY_DN156941_c0_g1~~TRINITY_DN156941_c0_g1_i1.p1  ORF type:complete len:204 (+),score=5.92 TRINITY_DN156941_c0_g1_i1:150-761(+)